MTTPTMTAAEIRAFRHASGKTQRQFGELLGVHWRTVQNWETEVAKVPGPVARLVRRLQVDHENVINNISNSA